MRILSSNSNYQWILSVKMFLISTGVLSMAVFVKLSVPVVADFFLSEIPSIWTSWLTPPYLYLLINCIITTILASSKLQQKLEDDAGSPTPIPTFSSQSYYVVSGPTHFFNANHNVHTNISDLQIHESNEQSKVLVSEMENKAADDTAITCALHSEDSVPLLASNDKDKTPVSSRIRQRKLLKPTPEGKPLGVSKPKRQDTLESTWRTITEGRAMPLTRHLRKSDTWESHGRRPSVPVDPVTPPPSKVMKKSETFTERSGGGGSPSPSPGASGRLKREPSLTQDELNRRVEAFIKKFNDEMRLQRQESFKQYQEMMGRGAH